MQELIDEEKDRFSKEKESHAETKMKLKDLEDEFARNAEFRRGASEYEFMQNRIRKLESDNSLYKKINENIEKELKKAKDEADQK